MCGTLAPHEVRAYRTVSVRPPCQHPPMTTDKWYLRANRHTDELGRYVQANRLHILDTDAGNAEVLEPDGRWQLGAGA
jgi:hypothetical protein